MQRHGAGKKFDVVTIGAATRDVFVKSARFEKRRAQPIASHEWDTCLPLGAKVAIDTILFQTGGGATNSAATFSRWGFKTACLSRVGNDIGGRELVAQLKKEKIDTSAVQIDPKERTGYSIILLTGHHDRTILTARGASKHIDAKKITWKALDTNWIYLTSVGGDRNLLQKIFSHAKQTRTHLAWNPGSAELDHGLKTLLPHLMQCDVLTLNREEAAYLADTAPRHMHRIVKTLGSLPRMALVVTDGEHGAYVTRNGMTWHAKALPGKQMNATGAGDAFGSGFVASLMMDHDVLEALRAATVNAHGVISHLDSRDGIVAHLPTSKERNRVRVTEYAT